MYLQDFRGREGLRILDESIYDKLPYAEAQAGNFRAEWRAALPRSERDPAFAAGPGATTSIGCRLLQWLAQRLVEPQLA